MSRRGTFDVGLRRVPELASDGLSPASDPELVMRIADEIRVAGPITFARFMELALYDPDRGYYATCAGGPGRERDFLTAPESHPIFGWTLARRIEQAWTSLDRPSRFVIREHGAGRGALAVAVLDGLRRAGSPLLEAIRYQAIERSPAVAAAFDRAIANAGLGAVVELPDREPADGVVLANELLDALPVHRVQGGPDGVLAERFVALGEPLVAVNAGDDREAPRFIEIPGEPSTPDLPRRLADERVQLEPGQVAEVCLEIGPWVASVAAGLRRGLAIVIDYGAPAGELYAPARGSTLRAYSRHRVHADPFTAVGRQDLTAHVDLTAVERAATANELAVLRRARQADYLAELGLGELLLGLQSGPEADLGRYLEARSAVVRLLDPRATGGFAVLELGRGLPA